MLLVYIDAPWYPVFVTFRWLWLHLVRLVENSLKRFWQLFPSNSITLYTNYLWQNWSALNSSKLLSNEVVKALQMFSYLFNVCFKSGVGKLQPMGCIRPTDTFKLASTRFLYSKQPANWNMLAVACNKHKFRYTNFYSHIPCSQFILLYGIELLQYR